MTDEMLNESREEFAAGWTRKLNIRLTGAAVGLALALLIASGSRRLFLAQSQICVPTPKNIASIAGSQVGVRPDPFEGDIALRSAMAVAECHPDDLQIQIANAVTLPPGAGGNPSLQKLQRLRALKGRFGNRPSLYANILRYEAQGEIRVHHNVEQKALGGDPLPKETLETARKMEAQAVDLSAFAAYDRDAAAGERLDPDNAYFPFMRAVGLFSARHDEAALQAIARASRKSQWQEYYNDELKGQWKLQDEGFVNNSALFHSISAMSILFPQYAQMRAAGRVTIFEAIQAERAGDVRRGLELRENVLRLGSLMRVQSASIIGSLVGNAITDLAHAWPAGQTEIKSRESDNDEANTKRRIPFDAYLRRIHADSAMAEFHAAQQAGDEMQEIVRAGSKSGMFEYPFTNLTAWWVADLVTLSNILWLLLLGGLAALVLRIPRLQKGEGLPKYMGFLLTLGVIGGGLSAPLLLSDVSSYFQQIASEDRIWMLLAGCTPALLAIGLPTPAFGDRLKRLGAFACGLLFGLALIGCYFWQAHGIISISTLQQIYFNMSDSEAAAAQNLIGKWFLFTPIVSLLILTGSAILSHVSRVPLSVGMARGLRGLMVPVAATVFLIYGGMLLCTIRAESAVEYGVQRTLQNQGQYLADLSGKRWPRSDGARKMANHE